MSGRLTCLLLLLPFWVAGQSFTARHQRILFPKPDSVYLDSLTVYPPSVVLQDLRSGEILDTSGYRFEPLTGFLYFFTPADSIRISYLRFNSKWSKSFKRYDYAGYKKEGNDVLISSWKADKNITADDLFDLGSMQYSGDFSRGISFGNNSDLSVQSSLNLQMSGEIADGIVLTASLTDNQLPFQAEGNTRQLQEFDKVFIRLQKDKHALTAGHLDALGDKGYFLRFRKKWMGASYESQIKLPSKRVDKGNPSLDIRFNAGVVRGNFARNSISVLDGNNGPYKLYGSRGESFIIILSGSERVYLDGVLQERGEGYDYVIDYNFGSIRFNPSKVLRSYMQLTVEFEYSDKNYLRSGISFYSGLKGTKLKPYFSVYSEQDHRNQPLNIELSENQIAILEKAGNNPEKAWASAYDSVGYTPNQIRYALIDTTVDGRYYDSIFIVSTDPLQAIYSVQFSYVGEGKGHYSIAEAGLNGRVYSWQAEQDGKLRGAYEPLVQLVMPKTNRVLVAGVEWQVDSMNSLQAELSYSNKDPNSFSLLDNQQNQGMALYTSWTSKKRFRDERRVLPKFQWYYEYKQQQFEAIERYRSAEFYYDWDVLHPEWKRDEHLSGFDSRWRAGKHRIDQQLAFYQRGRQYLGVQNKLSYQFVSEAWQFQSAIKYVGSRQDSLQTHFILPQLSIADYIDAEKKWKIGFRLDPRIRYIQQKEIKGLQDGSYVYEKYELSLSRQDSSTSGSGLKLIWQADRKNEKGEWAKPYYRAAYLNLYAHLVHGSYHTLDADVSLARIRDSLSKSNSAEFQLQGRLLHRFNLKKGGLNHQLTYELSNGLEPRLEFLFLESPDGVGEFAYSDYNQDGIRQQNEFYISPFSDENRFIRLINTSTDYVEVRQIQLNEYLDIKPEQFFNKSAGKFIKKSVSLIQANTQLQISRKLYLEGVDFLALVNPFAFNQADSLVAAEQVVLRQNLYLHRSKGWWSTEGSYRLFADKSILTSGLEWRRNRSYQWNLRLLLRKKLLLLSNFDNGLLRNYSQLFNDRRYAILYSGFGQSLELSWNKNLRSSLKYEYLYQESPQAERAVYSVKQQISVNLKYSHLSKGLLEADFSYAVIGLDKGGLSNPNLEFALLQGLQAGSNYLWSVSFSRKLSKNLQINLSYQGRQTANSNKTVHVGSANIRALF